MCTKLPQKQRTVKHVANIVVQSAAKAPFARYLVSLGLSRVGAPRRPIIGNKPVAVLIAGLSHSSALLRADAPFNARGRQARQPHYSEDEGKLVAPRMPTLSFHSCRLLLCPVSCEGTQ